MEQMKHVSFSLFIFREPDISSTASLLLILFIHQFLKAAVPDGLYSDTLDLNPSVHSKVIRSFHISR